MITCIDKSDHMAQVKEPGKIKKFYEVNKTMYQTSQWENFKLACFHSLWPAML